MMTSKKLLARNNRLITLLIFVFLASSLVLNAQVGNRYKLFAESGFTFNSFESNFQGFSLHVSNGMRIGSGGFYAGIGTGIDNHQQVNENIQGIDKSFTSVPIYLDLRFSFSESGFKESVNPYYFLSSGYTFPNLLSNQNVQLENNFNAGFYARTGLGLFFNIGARDICMNVNIGYRFESLKENNNTNPNMFLPVQISTLFANLGVLYKPSR